MSEPKTSTRAPTPTKAPAEKEKDREAAAPKPQAAPQPVVAEETQFKGGPIAPGASAPDQLPPSAVGTSQDPQRKKEKDDKPQHKDKE